MKKIREYKLSSKSLFIAVLVLSAIVILLMLFPDTAGRMLGANIIFFWALLAFSGIGLAIITYRERISGKLKLFLLSTGFSSAGFFLGVVLHNLFYALGILAKDLIGLDAFLNILEVGFFFAAIIICPIGILVGVTGTLILWKELPKVS